MGRRRARVGAELRTHMPLEKGLETAAQATIMSAPASQDGARRLHE